MGPSEPSPYASRLTILYTVPTVSTFIPLSLCLRPSVTVSLTSFTLPSPSFRRRRRRDDCKEDRAEGSKERLETGGGTK